MKILLKTRSDNPEYNADCDCAVVDLTPNLLDQIRCRVKMARKMLSQDSDLYELYFWGGTADFFSYRLVEASEAAGATTRSTDTEQAGHSALPGTLDLGVHEIQRTECDQMIVRYSPTPEGPEFEVAWVSIPKHTNIYVTTEAITLEDLESYVDGKSHKTREVP